MTTSEWALGTELRRLRTDAGLSQRQAASRAGISESKWRQLESGTLSHGGQRVHVRPKPQTVALAARAVGLSVRTALELAGDDPAEHPTLLFNDSAVDDRVPGFAALTERQRAAVVELVAAMLDPATSGSGLGTFRTGQAPQGVTDRGEVLVRDNDVSRGQTGTQ